jgi:tRNA G18 (ribose-2'-O)-methylase SpoU
MGLVQVVDLDDERLADYRHLREPNVRARVERNAGIFTVEGWLSLEALAESPYPVRSALVAAQHADRALAIVGPDVPVFAVPESALERVTGVHFHRGVVGVAARPEPSGPSDILAGARRVLVLESVNDYENLGSLFRNASAFGVDAVLLDPTTADPLYRRCTRVSLGHVLRVPFARLERDAWPSILGDLTADGFTVLALTPAAGSEPLRAVVDRVTTGTRVAVLVGAEGPGLSDAALAAADHRVRIPMTPGTDSVNVATAAAIALAALYDPNDPT